MSLIEITTINKKIDQTRAEISNLSSCTDENMRAIMTLQLETRLSSLLQQKEAMELATSKDTVTLRIYGDNVQRGKISSRVLLGALSGFQAMLDSVANAMLHSPTARGKIPEHVRDITAFEDRLSNLSERVLKKNPTEEEQTNYSESLFESM